MATGYIRQSAAGLIDGATIAASLFNAEYNQIQAAFNSTTGHNHDSSVGGGAAIPLATAVTGVLAVSNGGTGSSTASVARDNLGLTIGTNVQAYSASLNSIANLITASDKMIYLTGIDTYGVTTLTSFIRTLLDDTDAASARSTLGVTSISGALASINALSTTSNQMIYTTASDTYATASLTAFARTILDDSDAPTVRATIGTRIGTDVQAFNAKLTDVSNTSPTTNDLIYYNGSNYVTQSIDKFVAAGLTTKTTSFTLDLTMLNNPVICNSGSAIVVTIPPNATVAFPVNTQIVFMRRGAGSVTFSPGVGVTLLSPGSAVAISDQNGLAGLIQIAANTWALGGNL